MAFPKIYIGLIVLILFFAAISVVFIVLYATGEDNNTNSQIKLITTPTEYSTQDVELKWIVNKRLVQTVPTEYLKAVHNLYTDVLMVKSSYDNVFQEMFSLPKGKYTITHTEGSNAYETEITSIDLVFYSSDNNQIVQTVNLVQNISSNLKQDGSWNTDLSLEVDLTESVWVLPKITLSTAQTSSSMGIIAINVKSDSQYFQRSLQDETLNLIYTQTSSGDLEIVHNTLPTETTKWVGNSGNTQSVELPAGLYTVIECEIHNFQENTVSDIILATDLEIDNGNLAKYTKLVAVWGTSIGFKYDDTVDDMPAWSFVRRRPGSANTFLLTKPSFVQILKLNGSTVTNSSLNKQQTYYVQLYRNEI